MDNEYFLNLAIEEAKKSDDLDGYHVGAVITKNGKVISKAYSDEKNQNSHAEELAIKRSGKDISGATIYVTIEPCIFRKSGKTSCSDLIINSGIKKVVFGVKDPEIKVNCDGIEKLREAGIKVVHLKKLGQKCKQIAPSIF